MDEVALSPCLRLETDAGSPRLERLAVGAGRNFTELIATRQPNLEVVGLRRSKPHVAGAKQHRAVMQPELLEDRLRIPDQCFVFLIALVGMRELEQLHLLKLMLAKDAARIFPGRARLGAKARRPGCHMN